MADTDTTEPLYYTKHLTDSEQKIVARLVDVILATGYVISVYDGEAYPLTRSKSRTDILNNLGATEEEAILIRDHTGARVGVVQLVYGNEPGVVISDHSGGIVMNVLLAPVFEYAATFEE